MAYYTGDYPDEAIAEFKRAITQDPRAPDQHYYLGLAYLGHNPEAGFAKAEPEFRAELALSPDDFRTHYMLGYIALKQNRLQEADRELTKARSLRPDDQNMLLLIAELYSDLGRVAEAEPLLRKVIVLAGKSPANYEIIRAHYMLGRILQRTGKEEEAKKELALSEELRRQFREASGGTPKERVDPGLRNSQSPTPSKSVSPEERANAEAFLRGLSSPIAEAFNNLSAIAANRHQCPDCVNYFKHAGEWEPSLEGLDRNLGRAAFLCHLYGDAVPPLSRYRSRGSQAKSATATPIPQPLRYNAAWAVMSLNFRVCS